MRVSRPRTTTTDTPGASRAAINAFASESIVRRTLFGSGRLLPCGVACWAWIVVQLKQSARATRIFDMVGPECDTGWLARHPIVRLGIGLCPYTAVNPLRWQPKNQRKS